KLFYRLRVYRRTGAAGDDQWRPAEKELVNPILFAVLGEFLEIKNFAHAQAHRRDNDPVPGLVGFGGFIRPHLDAPGIGANRGDLFFLAPIAVLKLDAGRVAAGIAAPVFLGEAAFHLAGAHDDEIAASDGHVLLLCALIQLIVGNAFAVLHPFHAAKTRDIEQNAAPDHLAFGMFDSQYGKPARVDQLGVVAVVGLVFIKNVSQRIPVGGPLHAQCECVVGVADLVPV